MNFSRWFKSQGSDFLDMRLRRLPAGLFKQFYFLRCVAACNGGALPPVEKIAFLLGARPAAVERRLATLVEAGLLVEEGGVLRIVEGEDGGMVEPSEAPLSGAERTRRWRDRLAEKGAGSTRTLCRGDAPVTPGDAIEEDQEEETDSPRVTRGAAVYERFDDFLAAFPERDEATPREPAALAWGKAIYAGADPAELVRAAKAYREAVAGREKRFVVGAARWLTEGRWRGDRLKVEPAAAGAAAGIWIKQGSAEWEAWSAHWRETKGKRPPIDAKGGWRFPSAAPPEVMVAA